MIHDAAEQLSGRGFTVLQPFEDSVGTIGYGLTYEEENYILVAKEYSHDGLASFIATLVKQFSNRVDFIFYNDATETYTVFDGEYLLENAEDSRGESKRRDCAWKEITMQAGVQLDAYLSGETPRTLAGSNSQLTDYC